MPELTLQSIERALYEKRVSLAALLEEAVHTINLAFENAGIKIHSVEHRIKSPESILKKSTANEMGDPISDLKDLVGIRIVCLFSSDLGNIDSILRECFDVHDVEDKEPNDPTVFGYRSTHYVCSMRSDLRGPRYDGIKDLDFEIQARTVCMHAWAVMSHYLDYRSDLELGLKHKRDVNALSALFHLADGQFEEVYRQRVEAARIIAERDAAVDRAKQTPITSNNLRSYLRTRFANRAQKGGSYARFRKELLEKGFSSIEQVQAILERHHQAFLEYELSNPPVNRGRFSDIGVARITIRQFAPNGSDGQLPEA